MKLACSMGECSEREVVVTPLIALMKDKATMFTAKGFSAAYLSAETNIKTINMIYEGQFQSSLGQL